MKTPILLPVLLASCVFAAFISSVNHSSPFALPGDSRAATLPSGNFQLSPGSGGNLVTSRSAPQIEELRALLQHSLMTGGHARAFMELFARDNSQFQEYIELVLANADAPCEPSAQFSNRTCTAQSPKPESAIEP